MNKNIPNHTDVRLIDPIADPRWDQFVENHPYGLIYHTSRWKKVLENTFKQMHGYYFILENHSGGTIQAALPVYTVESWIIGRRLVSIPFATICDPLVSTTSEIEILLQPVNELYINTNSNYLELKALNSSPLMKTIKNQEFACSKQYMHHYIKLDSDLLTIKRRFHQKSVRYAINKAEKSNIECKLIKSGEELKMFYNLYLKTRKRLRLPPLPYLFFQNLWNEFSSDKKFYIILAYYRNKPIAGLAFFKFKKRVSTEFAGWRKEYKKFYPNNLLYWLSIKQSCEEECDTFDFGRTSTENTGLMNFKRRWGTIETDITHFYYPGEIIRKSGSPINDKKKEIVQKLLHEKTPNSVARIIGNFCYRHLG